MPLQDANPTPSFGGFGLKGIPMFLTTGTWGLRFALRSRPPDFTNVCVCRILIFDILHISLKDDIE